MWICKLTYKPKYCKILFELHVRIDILRAVTPTVEDVGVVVYMLGTAVAGVRVHGIVVSNEMSSMLMSPW